MTEFLFLWQLSKPLRHHRKLLHIFTKRFQSLWCNALTVLISCQLSRILQSHSRPKRGSASYTGSHFVCFILTHTCVAQSNMAQLSSVQFSQNEGNCCSIIHFHVCFQPFNFRFHFHHWWHLTSLVSHYTHSCSTIQYHSQFLPYQHSMSI